MKKIVMTFIVLGTLSAFAGTNEECKITAYEEIMSSKTVDTKIQELLANPEENIEKITAISKKAMDLAIESCD